MGRKAWNDAMRSAAGVNALPAELKPRTNKRRSDRKKKDRREKARKTTAIGDKELLAAAWMDALEDIAPSGPAPEDDDSYDELDELGDEKKRKRKKRTTKKTTTAGVLPKRFKPRSLASILLEEMNREDGVAQDWLNNEARDTSGKKRIVRKMCPVTGQFGIYTEPKSRIPYANLKALEIRERPPPWMTLSGNLAYHESVASIRDEER
mmetsp:Transcript_15945/g.39081  ORF Transcript_15945/g.39081 Transcript_15945/m.39081 type:complete len:208 (-) Transcript_15945:242-865(-)